MTNRPAWKLEEDRKKVTINLATDPPVSLELETAAVDELLRSLGSLRAHMTPEHGYDDPRGKKTEGAIINPRWAVETELMNRDILLHIRDPRFGTLSFLLPRDIARQMGQALLDLSEGPALRADPTKAN